MEKLLKYLAVSLVGLIFIAFNGCSKNNGNGGTPSKKYERAVEYSSSGPNGQKDTISYDGNNVTSVMIYDKSSSGDWVKNEKIEFDYSEDGVSLLFYDYNAETDNWVSGDKIGYLIQNGKIIGAFYYQNVNGTFLETQHLQIVYSGDNIANWALWGFNIKTGVNNMFYENDYVYDNNNLAEEHLFYKQNILSDSLTALLKTVYSYTNNELTGYIQYFSPSSGIWDQSSKVEYSYTDNRVSKLTYYIYDSNSDQWTSLWYYTYNYDKYGYLTNFFGGKDSKTTTIEYESGSGNLEMFIYNPFTGNGYYRSPHIKSAAVSEKSPLLFGQGIFKLNPKYIFH